VSKLTDALKAKFKTPEEALVALGLDASLLQGRAEPFSEFHIGGITMSKTALSKKAILAKGALLAILTPKMLAKDAKLDLDKVLMGVDSKNWLTKKPAIFAALKKLLAKDANMKEVTDFLDKLDGEQQPDDDNVGKDAPNPMIEEILTMLRGKISDEDLAAIEAKLGESPAEDEPPQTVGAATATPRNGENKEPLPNGQMDADVPGENEEDRNDENTSPFTAGKAMDMVNKAVREAEARTVARMQDIHDAEAVVAPYVGKLAIACDSADGVYKAALGILNVDIADVHPSAYKHILLAQPTGDKPAAKRVAADAALTDEVSECFPNVHRLRR
jgi:uncharacterized protein